jgi:hypothetical protein
MSYLTQQKKQGTSPEKQGKNLPQRWLQGLLNLKRMVTSAFRAQVLKMALAVLRSHVLLEMANNEENENNGGGEWLDPLEQ